MTYNKKAVKNAGRYFYKSIGYKNPMKKGKLSSSRIMKQLPKLAQDVMMLKSVINSEKKRFYQQNTGQVVGQVSGNSSGHYLIDLTPGLTQGTGFQNRVGNSVKLHSSFISFQFTGQTNTASGIRLKIQLVKVVGACYSTISGVMSKFINPNQFLTGTFYDMTSSRDPDYFKNFKILSTKYVGIQPDAISGQIETKYVNMGVKYKNHHIRYEEDTSTVTMGQIFLIITADRGNCNLSTANTTTGVPIQSALTGLNFSYAHTHYFYDN